MFIHIYFDTYAICRIDELWIYYSPLLKSIINIVKFDVNLVTYKFYEFPKISNSAGKLYRNVASIVWVVVHYCLQALFDINRYYWIDVYKYYFQVIIYAAARTSVNFSVAIWDEQKWIEVPISSDTN